MTPADHLPPDTTGEEFRHVVSRHAGRVIADVRHTLDHQGAIDERDVLRLVLARVLVEEPNASRLAARAAALVGASARLASALRQAPDRRLEALTKAVEELLEEFAAESPVSEGATT